MPHANVAQYGRGFPARSPRGGVVHSYPTMQRGNVPQQGIQRQMPQWGGFQQGGQSGFDELMRALAPYVPRLLEALFRQFGIDLPPELAGSTQVGRPKYDISILREPYRRKGASITKQAYVPGSLGFIIGSLLGGTTYSLRDIYYGIEDPKERMRNAIYGALMLGLVGGGGELAYSFLLR